MSESESQQSSILPSFDPQGTESISDIPERFLLDGLLSLTATGQWMFRGEPVEHLGVCLFLSKQLRRAEEGKYWVVNGPQRVFVSLEGTPFFITLIDVARDGSNITARLNDQSEEHLDLRTLFRDENEFLYAEVKRGEAGAKETETHLALVQRTAVIALEALLAMDENEQVSIEWNGEIFPIPQHPLS